MSSSFGAAASFRNTDAANATPGGAASYRRRRAIYMMLQLFSAGYLTDVASSSHHQWFTASATAYRRPRLLR